MTPSESSLVKDSFRQVAPIADQAAALFYARLFELDPSLRSLFRGDMVEQGRKLMAMIGTAVAALDRIETIAPAIRHLGARHLGYNVTEEHYATVGAALLWTLEKGLGPAFTPEIRSAWASVYTLLANTMIEGARNAGAPAPAAPLRVQVAT
jgi:hemoglobin-like flavoprotein